MIRYFLIALGLTTVLTGAFMNEPEQRTVIKLDDVKPGKERENLELYLHQGFWKTKYVWRPRWVKAEKETFPGEKFFAVRWKRVWKVEKVTEWEKVHASPPSWIEDIPGKFTVELLGENSKITVNC